MVDMADRIVDSARSRLPGAVDNNIYFEMSFILDDFFRISTCWREKVLVPVLADRLDYELESIDLPSRVISLLGFVTVDNTPVGATMVTPGTLTLTRALSEPGNYYAWVVLTVAGRNNAELYPRFPQWVADRYSDVIADGIVGRMMAQPAKPYSSAQHALFYSRKFRSRLSEIRGEMGRQNLVGGQNWRFPRFAAQR